MAPGCGSGADNLRRCARFSFAWRKRNAYKEEEREQEGSNKEKLQRKEIRSQGLGVGRARDEGDEAGQADVGAQCQEGYESQAGDCDWSVRSAQGGSEGASSQKEIDVDVTRSCLQWMRSQTQRETIQNSMTPNSK